MARKRAGSVYFDRNENRFIGIDDALKAKLIQLYPGVDLESELIKMSIWLNSEKGKRRTGTISFILNWLSNAPRMSSSFTRSGPFLPSLYLSYLQDIWKKCETLLDFNTKE